MDNLNNWNEVSTGYYRYVIAAKVCYEILIDRWFHDTKINNAIASLFITGIWKGDEGSYFDRELLLEGQTVDECIAKAIEDNAENNK